MQGVDLGPLVADPAPTVRDHVLFAHATAHTSNIRATRWAIRGVFDGRHKYARYYGVGGGLPNDDFTGVPTPMLYGPDAAFEDQEHEWYDQQEDPHELVNLAMDNGRRAELRQRFDDLLALEEKELARAAGELWPRRVPPYFMRVSRIEATVASGWFTAASTTSPTNSVCDPERQGVAHLAVHPGHGLLEHRCTRWSPAARPDRSGSCRRRWRAWRTSRTPSCPRRPRG